MTCLFVEHLTVLDCAYLHAQRGLVGESWIVDVELEGELDDQSMVLDFGEVKKRLKRALDGSVDHTLIVPSRAPELQAHTQGTSHQLRFNGPAAGPIEHVAPCQAVSLLDATAVDNTVLAAHLAALLQPVVPPSVSAVRIGLRHEVTSAVFFHYAHGLRKHAGHCQRIAHGHRSRLEIRIDGLRNTILEAACARRWHDIYLGSRGDLVAAPAQRLRFEYVSQEGPFALELPAATCDLLDGDSTVERIAEHLAARIARERPGTAIEVRAYEGVMKGAIARVNA